jgi:porin
MLAFPSLGAAAQMPEGLDVSTALRGLLQLGAYSHALNQSGMPLDSTTRGAGVMDLVVDYRPTLADELHAWVRFAAGNALNEVGGLALEPYGDPLEEELQDINGSGRNWLLEAWYKRRLALGADSSLSLTAGIIDAGEYLGENAFADESDVHFMNEALETSSIDMLSYNPGAVLDLEVGDWSASLVFTQSKNEVGTLFNWVSGQLGYRSETTLGEGNYRFFAFTSDGSFPNSEGTSVDERFRGVGLSFDQELGAVLGGFVRFIWADDNALVDYNALWSGGLNIGGRLWGRDQDNAGIAYAYLEGPPGSQLRRADVIEAYVRFQVTRHLDVSFDIQYQSNGLRVVRDTGEDDQAHGPAVVSARIDEPSAWIPGIRVNLAF